MSKELKQDLRSHLLAAHNAKTDISEVAVRDISGALTALLADVFAIYVKTKNFHWHMSGTHFRDYHLLLDEHGDQLFAMTDEIAERVRKIGGTTLRSIGQIARIKRIADNDADYVTPRDMLSELWSDNKALILSLRSAHELCDEAGDVASASVPGELDRRISETFVVLVRDEPQLDVESEGQTTRTEPSSTLSTDSWVGSAALRLRLLWLVPAFGPCFYAPYRDYPEHESKRDSTSRSYATEQCAVMLGPRNRVPFIFSSLAMLRDASPCAGTSPKADGSHCMDG